VEVVLSIALKKKRENLLEEDYLKNMKFTKLTLTEKLRQIAELDEKTKQMRQLEKLYATKPK